LNSLVVLVTAHTKKERWKWKEQIVSALLERVGGVSIYEGQGAFQIEDGSIMREPHFRIEAYGKDRHEIHDLYAWISDTLQEYLLNAQQECVLVIMNGHMTLIHPDYIPA
jgi:hypothetical protein